MQEVKIIDKTFTLSIPEEEILKRVKVVAENINRDYEGRTPIFLCVLNGAFMFASDLMKEINLTCDISFTKLSSYQGTLSTGHVHELLGISEDLHGRDVIIVEDIVESGTTIRSMLDSLSTRHPASVRVCTLFFKPEKLKEPINVDYVAIEISNEFIVGYGLDYEGKGRNLRNIYKLKQ